MQFSKSESASLGCPLRHAATATSHLGQVPASAGPFFRRVVFAAAGLFLSYGLSAQTPQYAISPPSADSIPQTTVVPVQQPPTQVVEHTTVYEESTQGMSRAEKRAYRAKVYAAEVDSLVQSRNYLFFPNSMQELPGGLIRSVFTDYLFFGVFVDHVEVHLPTERGLTQYVEMLNFDSMSIRNYQAARVQWGWTISFNITNDNALYHVDFAVSTTTGESVLTLITPDVTMRYVGWLWNKRPDDPKFRRL